MILHCYRKRMIITFFIRICGKYIKTSHIIAQNMQIWYNHIIHYKGFFQSSFLQETRWIPPGYQPTCSSSAANFVAPWKSTAPNPPRHRREWFECRCCQWPSHCPRQRQTLQLRQIDFEFSASRGGNHKKHFGMHRSTNKRLYSPLSLYTRHSKTAQEIFNSSSIIVKSLRILHTPL